MSNFIVASYPTPSQSDRNVLAYTYAFKDGDAATILIERVSRPELRSQKSRFGSISIKCLLTDPYRIVVRFGSNSDGPQDPFECFIHISNGLDPSDAQYEAVTLRVRLTYDGHLLLDLVESTDGVTFDVPPRYQKPRADLPAWVVRDVANGLAWAEINGFAVSRLCDFDKLSDVIHAVTETAHVLGHHLEWEDERIIR